MDAKGRAPIHFAAQNECVDEIKALEAAVANVTVKDADVLPGIVIGFGENLALELATVVIAECISIGIHMIQKAHIYSNENRELNFRIKVQIPIWKAIKTKFEDPAQKLMW